MPETCGLVGRPGREYSMEELQGRRRRELYTSSRGLKRSSGVRFCAVVCALLFARAISQVSQEAQAASFIFVCDIT